MQLSFLPKINRRATQRRVEEALKTARIYRQIGFVCREIEMTPAYEARYHGATNKTSDQVAEFATWNVDEEERVRRLTVRVERAVKRLPKRQRQIIEKRYLEDEDVFDYIVCTELGMSESTYGRQKAKAVY
ncbi:ArpU family phage packaging/lysis transcriptional regulator [Aneurinibacillus thermoaerophilus]|uniref:Phage transcriptional regulator, ArpU family n=1 Tax=Aneurinibacillus thermoaerophilus TaxID=143495 RepID=A0A1G7Y4Y2_ANETH|nr:ArpU family phage packaging/lysis transcriptional regulator [Aneurinibacillus thermoaerophilus]MED0676595.1 ArpU family phage packaging/lysis transcriptional regulator [Aneurinibacillus thermoaerophilus]MED0758186.1 ArpU family phage packaging/lysis transcriptional regulator [Aneurinibacillus thermoaerophilus]MED0761340.1 ArpU family phage packaging/lysis transcriptional regulator [Aneurinibacillus thermoaerophilus]SDG91474.1 phage transcriptional regulator, ArpU family [Aneurinibacillus the